MKEDYEIPAHLTEYGFQYGAATIERLHSDPRDGSVVLSLTTPKTGAGNMMQIRVTRTGKIRIFHNGEWKR
jgi:hypothetical protein